MSAIAAAVVGGVAAIGGAVIEGSAAESAASDQEQAEQNALGLQSSMYNQTVSNESTFLNAGQGAQGQLNYLLGIGGQQGYTGSTAAGGYGSLNAPFTASMMQQYSPAYQFQMQQGQQGTLNQGASAQGAESGAALTGLQQFNQGYANTAFNNAFQQYNTQQTNTFNRLSEVANTGQAAASNQATGGSAYAQGIGSTAGAIGTAQAAGTVGAANAIAGGLSGAANAYGTSQALPWLLSQGNNTIPAGAGQTLNSDTGF